MISNNKRIVYIVFISWGSPCGIKTRSSMHPIPRGMGYSRQTDKEFIQFLYIAKGSVSEIQSQLYVAHDLSYINEETFNRLLDGTEVIANLIGGFIRYLKKESDDTRHKT